MRRFAFLLGGLSFTLAITGFAQGPAGPTPREIVKDLFEGSVRGVTMASFVAAQHDKALAIWKRAFFSKVPETHEAARCLLYGTVPGKNLKDIGAALERHYALAAKALNMEQDEPWPGKIAVFLLNDR